MNPSCPEPNSPGGAAVLRRLGKEFLAELDSFELRAEEPPNGEGGAKRTMSESIHPEEAAPAETKATLAYFP
jgi:hypothetical protein